RGTIRRDLHVETCHLDRSLRCLACFHQVKHGTGFYSLRPQREHAASSSRECVIRAAHAALCECYIVKTRFPDQKVESQSLVQKLDQARLGGKGGAGAMTRLTQLHYARRADGIGDRVQIGKVRIACIQGSHRPRVFAESFRLGFSGDAGCVRGREQESEGARACRESGSAGYPGRLRRYLVCHDWSPRLMTDTKAVWCFD